MPRYLETAQKLREEVQSFVNNFILVPECETTPDSIVQLAHIINLAVRCSPRGIQGVIRRNIVATAMKDYCNVTMTEEWDESTGRHFNKIHITSK